MGKHIKYTNETRIKAVEIYLDGIPKQEIIEKLNIKDQRKVTVLVNRYLEGDTSFIDKRGKIQKSFLQILRINQKWSIDITYVPYGNDCCHLFCIKDLYDKSIVKYKLSEDMGIGFVITTLRSAFIENNIKPGELILHSDQGVHFSAATYVNLLSKFGVIGSHSRRGNCLYNSPIESFFSLFKNEALWIEKPKTLDGTQKCVDNYIEYYNYERYQIGLKEKTQHEIRFSA